MPAPYTILASLTSIANEWRGLAIFWHVLLAALTIAVVAGWRPSTRFTACVFAAPLASVSALAWWSGNPFNGILFAVLVFALAGLAIRLPEAQLRLGSVGFATAGAMLIAFGSAYPHFVQTGSWMTYVYAAPLGTLPCPTLSAVIGGTLMFGLPGSPAWSLTLAAAGVLYGAIGVFVLGVGLDWLLLAGALMLVFAVSTRRAAGAAPLPRPYLVQERP